ncbi:MAG: ribosome-associated translation inhibitor RaiA [Demequina sp.]|nr:ribosome-associated translation inhibitor RaiA [Demequina sp.]
MDIAIVGRHTKVNEPLRTRIQERMEKITELAPRATRAEVHVCHERSPRVVSEKERVEITLHGRGVVRAEASSMDREAAFDAAYAKLTAQLRKLHERKVHRHQGKQGLRAVPTPASGVPVVTGDATASDAVESVETWEGAPADATREVPIDGTPIVIRSKTHEAAPMTVPEAIDQMELVGHDFFLFHDVESDLPSAVYRRRGWTYGVIHLAAAESDESRESA